MFFSPPPARMSFSRHLIESRVTATSATAAAIRSCSLVVAWRRRMYVYLRLAYNVCCGVLANRWSDRPLSACVAMRECVRAVITPKRYKTIWCKCWHLLMDIQRRLPERIQLTRGVLSSSTGSLPLPLVMWRGWLPSRFMTQLTSLHRSSIHRVRGYHIETVPSHQSAACCACVSAWKHKAGIARGQTST